MATSDILLHGARLGGDTGVEKAAEAKTLAHDAQVSADLALSETDQIILDLANKEPAITVGTANDYFRGDKTWRDFGTDVKATVLSGLSLIVSTAVSASDSVVGSIGKLQAQITILFNSKADITYVDTGLSAKADKGISLSAYGILDAYTKTETDSRIQSVIGSAPAALDTLQELAAQLTNDESAVTSLTNIVSQKADKSYVDSGLASKETSIVAGTNSQYWRGDKSWRDLATDVITTVLTGLSTLTATAVVSTDSLLVAIGKLQAQINNKQNSLEYVPLNKAGDSIDGSLNFQKDPLSSAIKIDNGYGWRDLIGDVSPKSGSGAAPTQRNFLSNIRSWAYSANDQFDCVFHLPHDYLPGSDLFIHVHWGHNGTAITGTFRLDLWSTFAKGHQQQPFQTAKNQPIVVSGLNITNTPQYLHRVDEVPLSVAGGSASLLDTNTIEVDGLILVSGNVTTIPSISGSVTSNTPFIFTVDIHYQSTGLPTKNKSPNFYG